MHLSGRKKDVTVLDKVAVIGDVVYILLVNMFVNKECCSLRMFVCSPFWLHKKLYYKCRKGDILFCL